MDLSGVDYCDVFISCLNAHFDSTHSPQRIYWQANYGILHFSKSDVRNDLVALDHLLYYH